MLELLQRQTQDKLKNSRDALNATRAAVEEGGIVAGGGTSYLCLQ